ncbi:pimeloyl-ACP methyl ester carboxylesterase [Actinocorallia herbida]|uniref:Pimeloyl-ACP methyl ester carboxylesterase n=1 Tax=Actinocorallia herbida TaxID=58109 RepID=A0A3N1CSS2_9ACTN|nr:alpha/beta hydrolase [Actinocorallia herbida]ROO84265.1 pimeloyl-ACP methyl ester carboxylesterase [Actinocorallia herbida]
MPRYETEGRVGLCYEDVGEGPPVVLVAGWPLSQRFWEPQVAAFAAAGHRVVTYDPRGFGGSDRPWQGHGVAARTADLTALVDRLGLVRAAVVACSTGCAEAVAYAAESGRVSRLVLASPVLFPDPLADELRSAAERHRVPMLDDVLRRIFAVAGRPALDEPTRRYLLRTAEDSSPWATLGALSAWSAADPAADLARLALPVLVVRAEDDALVPPEDGGARVAAAIPGSLLTTVPDAPHGASYTHQDQWNRTVLDFLAE